MTIGRSQLKSPPLLSTSGASTRLTSSLDSPEDSAEDSDNSALSEIEDSDEISVSLLSAGREDAGFDGSGVELAGFDCSAGLDAGLEVSDGFDVSAGLDCSVGLEGSVGFEVPPVGLSTGLASSGLLDGLVGSPVAGSLASGFCGGETWSG